MTAWAHTALVAYHPSMWHIEKRLVLANMYWFSGNIPARFRLVSSQNISIPLMYSGSIIHVASLFPLPTRTIMPFWSKYSRSSSDSLSKSSFLIHLSRLRNCSIFVLAGSPPLRPLKRGTLEHHKFRSSAKSALFSKGFPTFSSIEATLEVRSFSIFSSSGVLEERRFSSRDLFISYIASVNTAFFWTLVLLWSPIYCFLLSLPQTQTGSALVRFSALRSRR